MEGYHTTYASVYSIDASCTGVIRTNNYDVGTDGVASSETLSGSDTVATSYRHTSKPTVFGSLGWNTWAVASASTNQGYYTNLPSGYRNWAGLFAPQDAGGGNPAVPAGRKLRGLKLRPK